LPNEIVVGGIMFAVYCNGKSADLKGFPELRHYCWATSKFTTLKEAQNYAEDWLGPYTPGYPLMLNAPYDYSGHGDIIEIREE
jgi:mannose-6-phosphate isomerase class I